MDVNGTQFHLLLGRDDWASCMDEQERPLSLLWSSKPLADAANVAWDSRRSELTLTPRVFRFKAAPAHIAPAIDNRRGAARDRYDNFYWIDATRREILIQSSGTGLTTHFWSSCDETKRCEPPQGSFQPCVAEAACTPSEFSALCVTEHHYLLAGVLDPAGLLIFDLQHGGPPRQLVWPHAVKFSPFDMSPAPGGGAWILDRENSRIWALDRLFNVIRPDGPAPPGTQRENFQPADGSCVRKTQVDSFPQGISLASASPLEQRHAIAIAALPDNTVLILESDPTQRFSLIYRFRFGQQLGDPVSTAVAMELIEAEQQSTFQLLGYDFAYVGDPDGCSSSTLSDVLYVTAADGEQTFAFQLTRNGDQIGLEPLQQYFPMRLFGGRGVIASGTRVFYDSRDQWVPLVAQQRPRYSPEAVIETRVFDGKDPDCVWHRLCLDACIPPETSVHVWSRANNRKDRLDFADWQPEPRLYLRGNGSEQPFVPQVRGVDSGTWELLLQRATGRYLQLQLAISGDGRSTPRLRALRSYYPRFSYLKNYMPAVYREDPVSASFLDRFLSNIEGFFTNIEDKIAMAEVLFEVQNAPPDVLAWLANWFGVALDPAWDETTQRLFLRHAMDFFQFRGTIPGLIMALRLVLEGCPDESIFDLNAKPRPGGIRLVEKFRLRRTPGVVLGDPGPANGLPLTLQTVRWLPAQGAAELHRRYTVALGSSSLRQFPVDAPADPAELAVWKQFSQSTLGFIPRVSESEASFWTDFLTRRYRQILALNSAWQSDFSSFDEIPLPVRLPSNQGPLRDWFQFQGVVLPMRDNAHRFSVLLPVPQSEALNPAAHQRRMDLAKRVIDLEKPAHTFYDMKFYWAFFRVGEARLGEDSVLDFGSRAPRLLPPMVLGNSFVASSYLAPGFPQDLRDRQILGHQVLSRRNTASTNSTGATS